MFALCSDIQIGIYSMFPHEVKVQKSIYDYVDRATIKLPISARLQNKNDTNDSFKSVETAKQFNEGDKVKIQLGYNGELENEFEGFVRRINFTSPVEVECEGYSYQLRMKFFTFNVASIELKDLLKKMIIGTDIILDEENIPSFKLMNLRFANTNGCQILEQIKNHSAGTIYFNFSGKKLWGGLIQLKNKTINDKVYYPNKGIVKYQLGWNVIKDNNLKQRQTNGDIIIVMYALDKDGTKKEAASKHHLIVKSGTAGIQKKVRNGITKDAASLQMSADAYDEKNNYDGYEGKITAFLQPYCEPSYKAEIIDLKYPKRGGTYNVVSTEVTYGMHGARRIVEIGIKLNY